MVVLSQVLTTYASKWMWTFVQYLCDQVSYLLYFCSVLGDALALYVPVSCVSWNYSSICVLIYPCDWSVSIFAAALLLQLWLVWKNYGRLLRDRWMQISFAPPSLRFVPLIAYFRVNAGNRLVGYPGRLPGPDWARNREHYWWGAWHCVVYEDDAPFQWSFSATTRHGRKVWASVLWKKRLPTWTETGGWI